MTKIISSQRYIDDEIVEAKRIAKDYTVSLSPAFDLFGDRCQLILDGHHSLVAARLDGVEPEYRDLTESQDDNIGLLTAGKLDDFLTMTRIDSDLYDIETGHDL